jgi:SNF2 family DNA or RNA helicase
MVMRLAAEDHLDMPELIISDILIDLDAKSRKIYKQFEDEFLAEIDGQFIMTTSAAAKGSKCRQVANGGVYDEDHVSLHIHDAKTQALVDLVEQLQGQPLLISYEFQHDIERIKRAFPDIINLTGLTGNRLDQAINDFNAGKLPYLLAHPMSAGHGLNLQEACHHVCYYGLTWDLDGYHQLYKRVYRQGQKSNRVFLYRILADGTLDKTVSRALRDKAITQSDFLKALQGATV